MKYAVTGGVVDLDAERKEEQPIKSKTDWCEKFFFLFCVPYSLNIAFAGDFMPTKK